MSNNTLMNNVIYIMDSYAEHIKNDKQLVLLYWQFIDGVEMDKEIISTVDFLKKSTRESDIISTKLMIEAVRNNNPWQGL